MRLPERRIREDGFTRGRGAAKRQSKKDGENRKDEEGSRGGAEARRKTLKN